LNEQDASDILMVLVAANELLLQELVEYLQKYLIENQSEWMKKHFELVHKVCFQSNNLLELQQFCTDLMSESPEKIFKSLDFTLLSEKSLIFLIKRDDLQMEEIEIWEYVLKWGLAQNPTLISDPATWTDDDFKTMENTLQRCLPLIRFFGLTSKDFLVKVRPYKKLLSHQLYEDLVSSYMDPDSEPNDNILFPRYGKSNEIIDSAIVNLNIVSLISKWIDKLAKNKFAYIRELYLPYEFKLLLRGSRDGFTPKKFHELCDNVPCTVTFIKVKGTEEILGGYNPLMWKSFWDWVETKDSFIFSFKNKNNFKDQILSYVKNINHAFWNDPICGPSFGDSDLFLHSANASTNYNENYCQLSDYEKKIRDTEEKFSIEDYEVFQILKNKS